MSQKIHADTFKRTSLEVKISEIKEERLQRDLFVLRDLMSKTVKPKYNQIASLSDTKD